MRPSLASCGVLDAACPRRDPFPARGARPELGRRASRAALPSPPRGTAQCARAPAWLVLRTAPPARLAVLARGHGTRPRSGPLAWSWRGARCGPGAWPAPPARSWHVASPPAQLARLRRRAPSCPIPALAVRFIVPLLSSLHNSVYVALVIAEVSFAYPSLLSVYLMRKSSNPVPNRVVVAPRLLSCSCRGRTHIRVCIACRWGLDDARLPVDDTRLPPRRVRAFAPFTRVVVAFRVRGLSASSPSIRATSRTRSAHTS